VKTLALAAILIAIPSFAGFTPAGSVSSVNQIANGVELGLRDGFLARVQWIDRDIVRFQLLRPADAARTLRVASGVPQSSFSVTVTDLENVVLVTAPEGMVSIVKNPLQWFLTRTDGSLVAAELDSGPNLDSTSGSALTRLRASSLDAFYGLGMNGGSPNRRGQRIWLRNTGIAGFDESTSPLHINIPFLWTIGQGRALGLFIDDASGPVVDVDSASDGSLTIVGGIGGLDYYLLTGPRPETVANAYGRLTGFQPLPPRWAIGYHQSRFGYRSQEEIISVATQFRDNALPLDAIYFDLDYMNRLQALTWDPGAFPNPSGMSSTLQQMGVKAVNIIEPCLLTADPLYLPLALNELLLLGPNRLPFNSDLFLGTVGWLDFGYDPTRNWYKSRLVPFLAGGIDGVWNDLNEPADNYMPETVIHRNGGKEYSHSAVRNLYPVQQTSLSYQALLEAHPGKRPFVLSRAGYAGIQKYAANWSGDINTSFDSLRTSVRMTISMGLSGQNLFGHDIGGFLGTPSPELEVRWMQFGAFTPFFRTHSNRDTGPREPWAYGQPYVDLIGGAIREHYRILPYLYSLLEQASRTGAPVIAPTAYHFSADTHAQMQDYDYMLGPNMLIAPVVEQGEVDRQVYLPAGTGWVDYYTGLEYTGGQLITVPLVLDRIPVFIRAGAILPKGDTTARNASESAARPLTIDFYPGPMGNLELYQDDGESFDYLGGAYQRTRWSKQQLPDGRTHIEAARSGSGLQPRTWTLCLLATDQAPQRVTAQSTDLPRFDTRGSFDTAASGWYFDATTHQLWIRAEDTGTVSLDVFPAQ
jgi:alpha-glucosidase